MSTRFKCKLCGKTLTAPAKLVGRKLKCPYCRAELTVPAANAASTFDPENSPTDFDQDEPPTDNPMLLFGPKEKHGDLIDMTAMVDIVFFLSIFFMVTSMVIAAPPRACRPTTAAPPIARAAGSRGHSSSIRRARA